MKNLFRKVDKIVLGIFLFAAMIATVATAMERRRATQWYAVTIATGGNPSSPADQQISSTPLPGSPTAPCNNASGLICAVQLTLDEGEDVPATIADANSDGVNTSVRMHRE